MSEVNDSDLNLTIQACFRYSLGRMTYMPSHAVSMIKNYSKLFNKHDWEQFISEIDQCDNLGMDCDKRTWEGLKDFAQQKIDEEFD